MPCLLSSEFAQKGKYNTNTDADKQKRIQKLFVSKQTWFAKKDKNRNRKMTRCQEQDLPLQSRGPVDFEQRKQVVA